MDSKKQRFTIEALASLLVVSILTHCEGMAIPSTQLTPHHCPPCDVEMELSEDQVEQAKVGLNRLLQVTDPLDPIPQLQFAAVTLSEAQINYVKEKFGMLFSSEPPSIEEDVIIEPTHSSPRERRDPDEPSDKGGRVCPVDHQSYRPLEIAINATGSIVQVVQFTDRKQWFIEEKCESTYPIADPNGNILCDEKVRLSSALVLNLAQPDQGFHQENIRIETCVSYFRV